MSPSSHRSRGLALTCVLAVVSTAAVVAGALGIEMLATGSPQVTAVVPTLTPAATPTAASAGPSHPRGSVVAASGWRWESYGGIEVQVPASWTYGTTGSPPCLQDADAKPYVGRPGPIRTIGCRDPVAALDKRVPYLWLGASGATPGVRRYDAGWSAETRIVSGVPVTVLADHEALRKRILASARAVHGTDAYGCPLDHRVRSGPRARPDHGAGGLARVGTVRVVTVCRYALARHPGIPPAPLLSGSRLTGPDAQALAADILAAPAGTGPNAPENCAAEVAFGEEVLVLRVEGGRSTQEIFVRYSGCDGHGTDDAVVRRRLTAEVVRPLLRGGPHAMLSGDSEIGCLVWAVGCGPK